MEDDPDPHGQAALMLCERVLLLLLEEGLLSKDRALDAISEAVDAKREMAGVAESVVVSIRSIGLLRAVAQSVSALAVPDPPTT